MHVSEDASKPGAPASPTESPAHKSAGLLRQIPSVSDLLGSGPVAELAREFGEGAVKLELRALLDEKREAIRSGRLGGAPDAASLVPELERRLIRLTRPEGRAAINAAGILLHTGLGRAPLCKEAVEALSGCGGYTILQASIEAGGRSVREEKIEKLLVELTGCEAATVVVNNAAATMIILNTLAAGKEVVISRSQLVEIGGSFRMPDVMVRSGCVLREVGATNRTHLRDYRDAISMKTGAIMHVHTSNYRIRGFAGWPDVRELCELGGELGVPVIDDIGSGALVPLSRYGITDEPLVKDSIAAGTEVACFSADKLICGPQGGVICGSRRVIERIRKNPLARMFRTSKMELAALEATLLHFVNGTYERALPFYQMLSQKVEELEARAGKLIAEIGTIPAAALSIEDDLSYVGSGSAPDEGIPTKVVRLVPASALRPVESLRVVQEAERQAQGALSSSKGGSVEKLARALRRNIPSVFARISGEAVLLDMRTVAPGEVEALARAVKAALH